MTPVRRLRLYLDIDGMLAVHAARALHTALNGIDGITLAQVTLGHAEVHYQGSAEDQQLHDALRFTAEAVGLRLANLRIEVDRQLPLAENSR